MNRNTITLTVLNTDGTTSEMVVKNKQIVSVRHNRDGNTFVVLRNGPPVVAVAPGYQTIKDLAFPEERES